MTRGTHPIEVAQALVVPSEPQFAQMQYHADQVIEIREEQSPIEGQSGNCLALIVELPFLCPHLETCHVRVHSHVLSWSTGIERGYVDVLSSCGCGSGGNSTIIQRSAADVKASHRDGR